MENLEEYFKAPTQNEIDIAWLSQLCYDGQMDGDEVDEHVEAVIEWKDKQVKNNVDLYIVSQQRELLLSCALHELDLEEIDQIPNTKRQLIEEFLDNNCG